MTRIAFSCCLWDPLPDTPAFSRCYSESWVDKLYRGVERHVSRPFDFVLFTDRARQVLTQIEQRPLRRPPSYGSMIEPFSLGRPCIIMGLDTVIVGGLDGMVDYCLSGALIGLPRDPYHPARSINAVALVPEGYQHIANSWQGENDMEWLRRFPWRPLDEMFPGQVLSLKFHRLRDTGLPPGARIVYMHGYPKPHELTNLDWIARNWR